MCVFSAFLKADKVLQHLMSMGNAFHRRGPTTRKHRSPKLVSFVRGITSKCCLDERVRPGLCLFSRFDRYTGAVPFRHRYTWRSILYSMRHLINYCISYQYMMSDLLCQAQIHHHRSIQRRWTSSSSTGNRARKLDLLTGTDCLQRGLK